MIIILDSDQEPADRQPLYTGCQEVLPIFLQLDSLYKIGQDVLAILNWRKYSNQVLIYFTILYRLYHNLVNLDRY